MTTIIRNNLMTQKGYTPYCGSNGRCSMPRTEFNGKQFVCKQCGWVSEFPESFIKQYVKHWKDIALDENIRKVTAMAMVSHKQDFNDKIIRDKVSESINKYLQSLKAKREIYDSECICDLCNNNSAVVYSCDLQVNVLYSIVPGYSRQKAITFNYMGAKEFLSTYGLRELDKGMFEDLLRDLI